MKRAFLPIAVLILVAAYFWLMENKPSPTESRQASPAPKSPQPPTQIETPARPVVKSLPKNSVVPDLPYAPYENRIYFKVEKAMAIAYGDLMLGTPEDEGVTDGYYEAPEPQLWDAREIPFAIHPDLPATVAGRVREALHHLEQRSGLQFVTLEDQSDAIVFEPGEEHCLSLLGKVGGRQPIRLSNKCGPSEIMHEVLHALGFVHEQSRADRDGFVEILWDNIEEKYKNQYAVVPETFMRPVRGLSFDYRSIMLYRPNLFAAHEGMPTMRSLTNVPIAPVEKGLSDGDVQRLNRMYPK